MWGSDRATGRDTSDDTNDDTGVGDDTNDDTGVGGDDKLSEDATSGRLSYFARSRAVARQRSAP